jgi:DNA-binding response OmpR family regulator
MPNVHIRKAAWSYVLDDPVRILVADDDPILREFASVHLATPTATILTASDGRVAFELLKAESCDLAILDIEMPALDGFELLQSIRADATLNQLPVMMLTGHEDIASIDRAFTLGANAFVSKPVNWRLLSYQIRYVLRACSLERQVRTGRAAASSGQPSSSLDDALREQCEAILREASPFCSARVDDHASAEARLQRIAKLAGSMLQPDKSPARVAGARSPAVLESLDASA